MTPVGLIDGFGAGPDKFVAGAMERLLPVWPSQIIDDSKGEGRQGARKRHLGFQPL